MGLHDPFGLLKHKLWLKEWSGIKLPIWLLSTKSRELPQFLCVQVVWDILLESSQWGLQLSLRPHLNRRSTHKIMGFQSCGNLGTKWHLGVGFVTRHKVYYKGEDGGFPQIRAMMSLMNLCLLVACPCTKVLQLHTNQLVV
jgi:hypothetical protein